MREWTPRTHWGKQLHGQRTLLRVINRLRKLWRSTGDFKDTVSAANWLHLPHRLHRSAEFAVPSLPARLPLISENQAFRVQLGHLPVAVGRLRFQAGMLVLVMQNVGATIFRLVARALHSLPGLVERRPGQNAQGLRGFAIAMDRALIQLYEPIPLIAGHGEPPHSWQPGRGIAFRWNATPGIMASQGNSAGYVDRTGSLQSRQKFSGATGIISGPLRCLRIPHGRIGTRCPRSWPRPRSTCCSIYCLPLRGRDNSDGRISRKWMSYLVPSI